jgi:predicted nucleic acid-binding protein
VKFLLDSNIYFAIFSDPGFLGKYREVLVRMAPMLYLSSVVRFELLQGAKGDLGRARVNRAIRPLERTGRVMAPTHEDWISAGTVQGRIWDEHPSLRTKDVAADILIVCSARRVGAAVVTNNARDFELIGRYLTHVRLTMTDVASQLGPG